MIQNITLNHEKLTIALLTSLITLTPAFLVNKPRAGFIAWVLGLLAVEIVYLLDG